MLLCALLAVTTVRAQENGPPLASASASIGTFTLSRVDNGLMVNAQINFELPSHIEEALTKGVPLFFIAEAEVTRDRWYWYDKKVSQATRQMRLSYQPLTRRWRLNVSTGFASHTQSGIGLPQYFDTLSDAMSSIKRLTRWRIADLNDIDASTSHTVELKFKLDLSQMPRPFQIGVIGSNEWSIAATKSLRLNPEGGK